MVLTSNLTDWKTFLKAGHAIFTVQNTATGNRFTFRVSKCKDKNIWFVSVLAGPDNGHAYSYLGAIFGSEFRHTAKARVGEDAPSFRTFAWLNSYLHGPNELPAQVTINHEGRCGRCGRRLTVPESIQSGFGPECIQFIH